MARAGSRSVRLARPKATRSWLWLRTLALLGALLFLAVSSTAQVRVRRNVTEAPYETRPPSLADREAQRVRQLEHDGRLRLRFLSGEQALRAHERVDPALFHSFLEPVDDERPAPERYAYCVFAQRPKPEELETLGRQGVRWLGAHDVRTFRVAAEEPGWMALIAHANVAWIGLSEPSLRIAPRLHGHLATTREPSLELWVSTFESDLGGSVPLHATLPIVRGSARGAGRKVALEREQLPRRMLPRGWQQRRLERLGAKVIDYEVELHAFRVFLPRERLSELLALDFVAHVELVERAEALHQESTPMIGSDYVRAVFDGGTNQRAIAGMIDSGMQLTHDAFLHLFAVGWDFTGSSGGEWVDDCVHGTHVAGTILGDPPFPDTLARGNAHGLGFAPTARFRSVKDVNGLCLTSGTSPGAIYAVLQTPFVDGQGHQSPKPHVVNSSWGLQTTGSPSFSGTELEARLIDQQVYLHEQLYVFSAGNTGPGAGTIAREGCSKNAMTVGYCIAFEESTTRPAGSLGTTSSRGPCADGRWKPNLVAPGGWICSSLPSIAQPYGSPSPATSWAAPHVTGVVAQLVDQYPAFAYRPHALQSVLMATSVPEGWTELGSLSAARTHLENRGVGQVAAFPANFATPEDHWTNWDFTVTNQYVFADFDVPSTATRVVICMVHHEAPSTPGAPQAVVKDLDLYIDAPPIDTQRGNTGDYVDHQSAVDNVEIRSFDVTPQQAGTWRFKVYPNVLVGSAKVSVTVRIIEAPLQRAGSLALLPAKTFLQPGELVDVLAICDNDAFLASQVFIDTWANRAPGLQLHRSFALLKDGVLADYLAPLCSQGWAKAGWQVMLGEIAGPDQREIVWTLSYANEGTNVFQVEARGLNWGPHVEQVTFTVDGTPPSGVSLEIEGGAAATDTPAVMLTLAGSDSLSGLHEMRFKNDHGSFSPWEPFATTRSWNLTDHAGSAERGTRRVEVEVRDRSLNVTSAASTIYWHYPVTTFGTACPGALGPPAASVLGIPGFGQTLSFSITNTLAPFAALQWGASDSTWLGLPLPFDLGILGSPGCTLTVSPDVLVFAGAPTPVRIAIPSDPAFLDVHQYTQWFLFLDPSGLPIVSSEAHGFRISGF